MYESIQTSFHVRNTNRLEYSRLDKFNLQFIHIHLWANAMIVNVNADFRVKITWSYSSYV